MKNLLVGLFLLAFSSLAAAAQPQGSGPQGSGEVALRLDKGSIARNQMVALGKDVIIAGDALGDVAALEGSVEVTGRVEGDVVVLGGDARLGPEAQVGGDIFVVGGTVRAEPGARVAGRMVSYPTASSAMITLMEGPSLNLGFSSPLVLGAKLALLASWAALLVVLFAASGRQILETADGIRREPFRSFATGLTGVLALILTALFFSAFTGGLVGVPLLVLIVLLGMILKLWGMVAVFYALGDWLSRRVLRRHRVRPLNAATLGLVVLGIAKFIPWIGVWAWTAATLIGIGAALSTKFGRQEPWFELA